jgi:hypothetical protein
MRQRFTVLLAVAVLFAACQAVTPIPSQSSEEPTGFQAATPTTNAPSASVSPSPSTLPTSPGSPTSSSSPSQSPSSNPSPTEVPLTSPIGVRWDPVLSVPRRKGGTPFFPMVWSGGFATLEFDQNDARRLWTSPDGYSWQSRRLPFATDHSDTTALPFKGGLALGKMYGGLTGWKFDVWTSMDAEHWDRRGTVDTTPDVPGFQVGARMISTGTGLVVLEEVGTDLCCGNIAPPGGPLVGLTVRGLAAVTATQAEASGAWGWVLSDGTTWTKQPLTGLDGHVPFILDSSDTDVLAAGISNGELSLLRSTNGIDWQAVAPLPSGISLSSPLEIAHVPDGYLIAADTIRARGPTHGARLTIWTGSGDGVWSEVLDHVGWGADEVDAVGSTVVVSSDFPTQLFNEKPLALISTDGGTTFDVSAGWSGLDEGCYWSIALRLPTAVAGMNCSPGQVARLFAATMPTP